MKNLIYLVLIAILVCFCGCNDNEFDLHEPEVMLFVEQIKNGTYNEFHYNDAGERIWALMPEFGLEHVPQLVALAADTSFIPELDCVPFNPMSSRTPWPLDRPEKIYLGEYLLWCAQYAIEGHFPSLDPFIVNSNREEIGYGINGKEVLEIRTIYQNWWQEYGSRGITKETPQPLSDTSYRWF
jgi:hypothetical protein